MFSSDFLDPIRPAMGTFGFWVLGYILYLSNARFGDPDKSAYRIGMFFFLLSALIDVSGAIDPRPFSKYFVPFVPVSLLGALAFHWLHGPKPPRRRYQM